VELQHNNKKNGSSVRRSRKNSEVLQKSHEPARNPIASSLSGRLFQFFPGKTRGISTFSEALGRQVKKRRDFELSPREKQFWRKIPRINPWPSDLVE
jgi:hypothetical protein